MSTIHGRLREERNRLGLSQEKFAAIAGITRRPYVAWEAGETAPTVVQLAALANVGVDVLYVITGARSAETLAPDEAALLDNYRHSPKEQQKLIQATSAAFAQSSQRRHGRS